MKKLLLYAVSAALGMPLSAQESKTIWQKDFQSSTQDFLTQVSITPDGQYLISGSSINPQNFSVGENKQNNGYDYRLLKLDQNGDKVWEKYFAGNRHDYLAATAATREGGFILAGTSYSTVGLDKKDASFGGSDIWIVKVGEDGEEQWQKTIGTRQNEEAKAVVQTTDQGYFVAADVLNHKQGFGNRDVLVVKLDKKGKVLRQTILGGGANEEVERMIPTNDGGILLGIYSRSGEVRDHAARQEPEDPIPTLRIAKDGENYGEGDYWVVKLDRDGKPQWQKNYGGKGDDRVKTLSYFDGGYLVGGESRSSSSGNKQPAIKEGTDLWFVALDKDGGELWQKSYTFGNRDVLMSQNTIFDRGGNKAKGFLVGGYTQAEGKVAKDDETFWMLYLDTKGDEVWRKHVEGESRQKEERLVDAMLQNDGTYILAGTSATELGRENWKVVKLGDKLLDDLIEKQDIRVYPNPVGDYCYVEIGRSVLEESGNAEAEIRLHDMAGKQIQTLKTRNMVTKISTAQLPQGVYVVTATAGTKVVNTKIVKR